MKYIFHELNAKELRRKFFMVIKLTSFLLMVAVLQLSGRGMQTITISGSDIPLEKVCKTIERQTGYYFVYPTDLSQRGYRVTIDVRGVTIDEALTRILEGLPISYQVIGKVIVLKTIQTRKFFESISDTTKEELINVSGVVLSEVGLPLSGATITVKTTGKSTLTNIRGQFSLSAIRVNSLLMISYIGYSSQQWRVRKGETMRIQLMIATNSLDIKVVKGYYNTTNRLNTGSVASIKAEDIAKQPVVDPLLAMEGRIPGLYIQQTSGIPGAYGTIRLRGANSIPSTSKLPTINNPLFIIDGVPFNTQTITNTFFGGGIVGIPPSSSGSGLLDNATNGAGLSPFNSINPLDIESIEVLKDADATAIYGSRGGNGVVVITTKRGRVGAPHLTLNVLTGVSRITHELDLMNTNQYLQMRREAFKNDGVQPGSSDYDINGVWDTTRYTDWQKTLIGNAAPFTNAQMNLSGGNSNTQFLLGGGYSNLGTTLPGNYSDQKVSMHVSITNSTSDTRFRTQFSASYSYDKNNLPASNLVNSITLAPNAPALFNSDGKLNWQVDNGNSTWDNPLSFTNSKSVSKTDFLTSNVLLSYQLVSNLEIKSNLGYTHTQSNQSSLFPLTVYGPPISTTGDLSLIRTGYFATTDNRAWILEPQIVYKNAIGYGKFDVMVGATFQRNSSISQGLAAYGYSSDALIGSPAAARTQIFLGYTSSAYYYNAIFGHIGYNLGDKYLLNVTARRDGSSRFGPGRQFGNFGAVGVGWIFSHENFLQELTTSLSFGKLRASYGITGNDNIGNYQFMSSYLTYTPSYQGVVGLVPARLPNPLFSWERVKKLEVGMELGFFKDRLLFSVDYYRNRCDNQLVGYKLPLVTGFGNVQANLPALVQNSGLEFTMSSTNIRNTNIIWTSTFNMTIPSNKLLAYPGLESSVNKYDYAIGKSLFVSNVYHYTGVDPESGTYRFSSKQDWGYPAFPRDNVWSRPLTQILFGGLQNTFRYKGFELDIFLQFVEQWGRNYLSNFQSLPGTANQNMPTSLLNRWQKAGDFTSVQKFSTGLSDPYPYKSYVQFLSSDAVIENSSFIRLKTLHLSYQLSEDWRKKMHLQNMQIYMQCQNILTFTGYKGLDPETGGLLPPMKTVTVGLQCTF